MSRLNLSPILLLLLTLVAALAATMAMVVLALQPPPGDIQQLLLFMTGTGGATIAIVYWLYRRRLVQRFTSLRWTLLAIIVLTVVLVFVNVFITAQLMFISEHDLILTSALLIYAGVIAIISMIFIASTLTERIQQVVAAAQDLAGGALSTRLPTGGNDELARLTAAFNEMAEQLEAVESQKRALDQSRRDLVAWVSHDLRSPLAAIRVMNEAILDGVVTDEATINRYRQQMSREIEHMGRLIGDLFELVQIDAGAVALNWKPAHIGELIGEALERLSIRAVPSEIHLDSDIAASLPLIRADADKIERVIYNLLENALQHTPPGGRISVRAGVQAKAIRIEVHNTGSYIPPQDRPQIFERFYRAENARTPRLAGDRGAGLGLAIARGFVAAHAGSIMVESDAEQGTRFIITLPL